jgi:hypothetical protein
MYGRGAYVSADYRHWLRRRVRPLLARHGLDGSARIEPARDDDGFPSGSLPERRRSRGPGRADLDESAVLGAAAPDDGGGVACSDGPGGADGSSSRNGARDHGRAGAGVDLPGEQLAML